MGARACGTSQADLQKDWKPNESRTGAAEYCINRPASGVFGDDYATDFLTPYHTLKSNRPHCEC